MPQEMPPALLEDNVRDMRTRRRSIIFAILAAVCYAHTPDLHHAHTHYP
jgi:hypothetical protein